MPSGIKRSCLVLGAILASYFSNDHSGGIIPIIFLAWTLGMVARLVARYDISEFFRGINWWGGVFSAFDEVSHSL